ncbi:MAG: ferritin-like domain-containing protein [Myxococcota bacterium]
MRHVPPNVRFRSLVATALALAACSPTVAPAPAATASEPRVLDEAPSCDTQPGPGIGTALTPAHPIEALAVAERFGETIELRPVFGTVCTEGAACIEPLFTDRLRLDCGQAGCVESALVWTRDGQPGAATTLDALLAFLGPVDSTGDARLVAWAAGYRPTACEPETDGEQTWNVTVTQQISDCPVRTDTYDLAITTEGTVTVTAHREGAPTNLCIGRLPPGLESVPPAGPVVASWLARAAHLEAASIHAFRQLHRELVHHDAPAQLREAALACLTDEVRHARLVGDLARARGATVSEPRVGAFRLRPLVDIARDNAAEGCGREAWGAVVGQWQGHHAADHAIRTVMAAVAEDEVRHAEFSFALDAWLRSRLTRAERARVDRAARRSRRRLAAEALQPVPSQVSEALGLPNATQARAMWSVLAA